MLVTHRGLFLEHVDYEEEVLEELEMEMEVVTSK